MYFFKRIDEKMKRKNALPSTWVPVRPGSGSSSAIGLPGSFLIELPDQTATSGWGLLPPRLPWALLVIYLFSTSAMSNMNLVSSKKCRNSQTTTNENKRLNFKLSLIKLSSKKRLKCKSVFVKI